MPGVGGAGAPSLSEIVSWDVGHLEQAASDWSHTATQWEDDFGTLHRETAAPGGTVWDGEGADAAQERSFADLVKVRGVADTLHDAAVVARRGADNLQFAQRSALEAVTEAEDAGFTVGHDLSVTSRQSGGGLLAEAQRATQAQEYAATIGARAAELSALDKSVAASITAAMAPLAKLNFGEAPAGDGTPPSAAGIQLVDNHTFKQGPDLSPTPEPGTGGDGPQPVPHHPTDPRRDILGHYTDGNDGRDGKWEEKLALDNYAQDTGVPIIRDKVRATHPGVLNPDGSLQGRLYDGLQPTGNPGEYIGIEAKRDGVKLRGLQARFDAQVTPQSPATATLNGKPITIVGTQVVHPDLPQSIAGTAGSAAAPTQGSVSIPGSLPAPGGGGGSWGDPSVAAPSQSPLPGYGTYVPPEVAATVEDELGPIGQIIVQSPEYQATHPPPTA